MDGEYLLVSESHVVPVLCVVGGGWRMEEKMWVGKKFFAGEMEVSEIRIHLS